jgi:hypothetical protein
MTDASKEVVDEVSVYFNFEIRRSRV